jgi:hypothetical protein
MRVRVGKSYTPYCCHNGRMSAAACVTRLTTAGAEVR